MRAYLAFAGAWLAFAAALLAVLATAIYLNDFPASWSGSFTPAELGTFAALFAVSAGCCFYGAEA